MATRLVAYHDEQSCESVYTVYIDDQDFLNIQFSALELELLRKAEEGPISKKVEMLSIILGKMEDRL